jgi:hypothetical protein
MKKLFFVTLMIATLLAMASCQKQVIDPVNDVVPCDTTFWSGNIVSPQGDTIAATTYTRFDLAAFQALGQNGDIAGMRQMVDEHRVELTTNIVAHFPELSEPDSIHFELWTGHVKDVLDGDGGTHSGAVRNELVFRITDPKLKTIVFLACGNGMLCDVSELEQQGLTRIDFGTAIRWLFVIGKGEGVAKYLPYQDWNKVIKNFPVPFKDKEGKIVPLLFPGDTIDMVHMEVRNAYGRVDFERRQTETKKANAEAAAKAKATKAKTKRQRRR